MSTKPISLRRTARRRWSVVLAFMFTLPVASLACDSDADCRVGGTCIKREKRASGVCYGGSPRAPAAAASAVDSGDDVPVKPVTGARRENAKAWLGDPDQMIKDHLPGKEVGGTCMVTQDCAADFECVVAGFEGHCVKL